MKKFRSVYCILLVLFTACESPFSVDQPSISCLNCQVPEGIQPKIIGAWQNPISVINNNQKDVTNEWSGFMLDFRGDTNGGYGVALYVPSYANEIWPESYSWYYLDESQRTLSRNDKVFMSIVALEKDKLTLSVQINEDLLNNKNLAGKWSFFMER